MEESKLRAVWDTFDVDKSGSLDRQEALRFIKEFLNALEKKELDVWDVLSSEGGSLRELGPIVFLTQSGEKAC